MPPRSLEGIFDDNNEAAAMYADRGAEVAMDPSSVPSASVAEEEIGGTSEEDED